MDKNLKLYYFLIRGKYTEINQIILYIALGTSKGWFPPLIRKQASKDRKDPLSPNYTARIVF